MSLAIILLVVALPLIEIALLVKLGQMIGFWPTMGLIVATGALGTWIVRRTGLMAFQRLQHETTDDLERVRSLLDDCLKLVAGGLLILPGVLTDAIGLVMLVPLVRSVAARRMSASVRFTRFEAGRTAGPEGRDGARHGRPDRSGQVIEGEFRRIDERSVDENRDRKPPR